MLIILLYAFLILAGIVIIAQFLKYSIDWIPRTAHAKLHKCYWSLSSFWGVVLLLMMWRVRTGDLAIQIFREYFPIVIVGIVVSLLLGLFHHHGSLFSSKE
jgi:hypothetical protein